LQDVGQQTAVSTTLNVLLPEIAGPLQDNVPNVRLDLRLEQLLDFTKASTAEPMAI
jgi:hypothetical protein